MTALDGNSGRESTAVCESVVTIWVERRIAEAGEAEVRADRVPSQVVAGSRNVTIKKDDKIGKKV